MNALAQWADQFRADIEAINRLGTAVRDRDAEGVRDWWLERPAARENLWLAMSVRDKIWVFANARLPR